MRESHYRNIYGLEDENWWWSIRREYIFRSLNSLRVSIKGKRILDVGCGTGGFMGALAASGAVVYGADLFRDALAYCSLRGIRNLFYADGRHLPIKKEIFDIVTCLDVLYHQRVEEDTEFLKELRRVCKVKGLVVVTVAAFRILRGNEDILGHGVRRYTVSEIEEKMRTAGFDVLHSSYMFGLLFPFVLVVRLLDRLKRMVIGDENLESDFSKSNKLIDSILRKYLLVELSLSRHLKIPFGSSILCIGVKNQA